MTQRQLSIFDTQDDEQIGVSVGHYFAVVPKAAAAHIKLDEDETINFGGEPLTLYRGVSFIESRKVDKLLDEYGEHRRSEYDYWHNREEVRVESTQDEISLTPDELGESFQQRLNLISLESNDVVIDGNDSHLYDDVFSDLKKYTDKDPESVTMSYLSDYSDNYKNYLKNAGAKPVEIDKIFNPRMYKPSSKTKEQVLEELRGAKDTEELIKKINELQGYDNPQGVFNWGTRMRFVDGFYRFVGNQLVFESNRDSSSTNIKMHRTYAYERHLEHVRFSAELCYFDDYGKNWQTNIEIGLDHSPEMRYVNNNYGNRKYMANSPVVTSLEITDWKEIKRVPQNIDALSYLHSREDMERILNLRSPYTRMWLNTIDNKRYSLLLFAPQLEQLYKAGFEFAQDIVSGGRHWGEKEIQAFNVLCKKNSKLGDIFQTDKVIYNLLKYEPNLLVWDSFRKMYKQGKMTPNAVELIYNRNFRTDQLKQLSSILGLEYQGKKVFTWEKLTNYLGRLDMYQAIGTDEAIPLIRDTFNMSIQLGIEPNVNSDSLKREHDVLARTFRQQADRLRSEKLQKGMERALEVNKKYNYQDEKYFIRAITDYDDLINEAKMQHNCVASYAEQISRQSTKIYVMRRLDNPEQSLITVELANDSKTIRQKYLKFNQPVQDPEQNAFFKTWIEQIELCNKGKYESINAMLQSTIVKEEQQHSQLLLPKDKVETLVFGGTLYNVTSKNMDLDIVTTSEPSESYYDPLDDQVYINTEKNTHVMDENSEIVQLLHATAHHKRLNRNIYVLFGESEYKYEAMVVDRALEILSSEVRSPEFNQENVGYSEKHNLYQEELSKNPAIAKKVDYLAREAVDYLALKSDLITQEQFNKTYSCELNKGFDKVNDAAVGRMYEGPRRNLNNGRGIE